MWLWCFLIEIICNFINMGEICHADTELKSNKAKGARGALRHSVVAGTTHAIQKELLGNGSWYLVK